MLLKKSIFNYRNNHIKIPRCLFLINNAGSAG